MLLSGKTCRLWKNHQVQLREITSPQGSIITYLPVPSPILCRDPSANPWTTPVEHQVERPIVHRCDHHLRNQRTDCHNNSCLSHGNNNNRRSRDFEHHFTFMAIMMEDINSDKH
jgi:hypothetical protein